MNKRFIFLRQNKIQVLLFLCLSFIPRIAFAESEGAHSEPDYIGLLFVFMLSTFIGLGVVTRVSRLLHTPLMSLTNAISAIAVVGSLILTGLEHPDYITILGAVALFASMTNIVSGFLITDRMLKMFKSKESKKS
jgi:H+-translocating NAD(P) transhydrogenase subunit alpha